MDSEVFWKSFICQSEFVTHEFSPNMRTITVGMYQNRLVAVKVGRDLHNEIEIMKKIGSHPYVIEFISEIQEGDRSSIVMEGIPNGLTIDKYCSYGPPLSLSVSVGLIRQLALGLSYLHSLNIIHHDLKSENVLFDETTMTLKICDFDISEITDEYGHAKEENRKSGTYRHMAPEQKIPNHPITNKIDVYAFGSIGRDILFKGKKARKGLLTTPITLINLLYKCEERNPENRPDIDTFLRNLDQIDISEDALTYQSFIDLYNRFKEQSCKVPEELQNIYDKIAYLI